MMFRAIDSISICLLHTEAQLFVFLMSNCDQASVPEGDNTECYTLLLSAKRISTYEKCVFARNRAL